MFAPPPTSSATPVKAFRWHQFLPIDSHAFSSCPLPSPCHQHLFEGGLTGTRSRRSTLHLTRSSLPNPCPYSRPCSQSVQPQMRKAWELCLCPLKEHLDPIPIHDGLALWTLALSTKPWVSTSKCRFLPFTFLPLPSYPRCSPPTPVVFTDWLSTMPALG
jgi:hypothetical protein